LISAIKAGKVIVDEKQRKSLIEKLNLLCRFNQKIAVFGISGAGKSQFINSLGDTLEIPKRTIITDKYRYDLDKFPIEFFDTPGHSARQQERKKVLTDIIKDKFIGIINVVSYGYEENPDAELDIVFDSNKRVKDSFLSANRSAELERISEWLPSIETTKVKWVVNLVNKADIWWENQTEVNKYYSEGHFDKAIKSINNTISVFHIPYCSIIQPYFETNTSGKFGEIDKIGLHKNFLHLLLNLLKT